MTSSLWQGTYPPYKSYAYPWIDKALEIIYRLMLDMMLALGACMLARHVGWWFTLLVLFVFFTVDAMRKETIYGHSDMGLGPNRLEVLQENIAGGLRSALLNVALAMCAKNLYVFVIAPLFK